MNQGMDSAWGNEERVTRIVHNWLCALSLIGSILALGASLGILMAGH